MRWADLDPNFHMRHSAYYDFGASVRIDFLQQNGFTTKFMKENAIGPVIFREECVFKKELNLNDSISVNLELIKATYDYTRWSIRHTIFKNGDTVSALLNLDGAWFDTNKRKLTMPPKEAIKAFDNMPRAEHFEWVTKQIN